MNAGVFAREAIGKTFFFFFLSRYFLDPVQYISAEIVLQQNVFFSGNGGNLDRQMQGKETESLKLCDGSV